MYFLNTGYQNKLVFDCWSTTLR